MQTLFRVLKHLIHSIQSIVFVHDWHTPHLTRRWKISDSLEFCVFTLSSGTVAADVLLALFAFFFSKTG